MPEVEEEPEPFVGCDEPMGFVDLMLLVLARVFCDAGRFKRFYTRHYFNHNEDVRKNT